jgi:hypothetical protein
VQAWTHDLDDPSSGIGERNLVAETGGETAKKSTTQEDGGDVATRVAFIEAQTKRLKKAGPDDVSELKLSRAVAAMADLTDQPAPDDLSSAFVTAWKRTPQCHHFWGPTVGQERFCTKCQIPRSAAGSDDDTSRPSRRSSQAPR